MFHKLLKLGAIAALASLSWFACGAPAGTAGLEISASPRTINDTGQVSVVTVRATNSLGKPGTGSVNFKTPAGSLKAGVAAALNAAGEASADFSCAVATDPGCVGTIRVSVDWTSGADSATNFITVQVGTPKVDSGTGGGSGGGSGTTGGGSGTTGGGSGTTGGGTGTADAGPLVTVTSAKPRIYLNVNDSTVITATYRRGSVAQANEVLTFTTDLGSFVLPDAGTAATMATTNTAGAAALSLVDSNTPGIATITVTTAGGATGTTAVEIGTIMEVKYVNTTCAGAACTIMGIRGSGFNETAQVKFKIIDQMSRPVSGVPVAFTIDLPPGGTTVSPDGITNAQGEVVANVSSGSTTGSIKVKASTANVSGESPTIGIRGAKPTNRGMSLDCEKVNLAVFTNNNPSNPRPFTMNCKVTLLDRFLNPVGVGTTVNVTSEAGNVPASITTKAYPDVAEGTGTFVFNTVGVFPPVDVAPLAALATQQPFPRIAEPSDVVSATLTRNPRDGLVSLIAAVRGEEFYADGNNNGAYDTGEQFIDQGEPLVDANDNGVYDIGESYVDINNDTMWNGPNGTWDGNQTIWVETRILYTGFARGTRLVTASPYAMVCPGGVDKQPGAAYLDLYGGDENLNRTEIGSPITITYTGSKGAAALFNIPNALLDGYGYGAESGRKLMTAAGDRLCMPADLRCVYKWIFTEWNAGYRGQVRVLGATATDTTPCATTSVTAGITVQGVANTSTVMGSIK